MNVRIVLAVLLAFPSFVMNVEGLPQPSPTIVVTPAVAVEGEPVSVTITGLEPGQAIVLHACRMWDRYPTGSESYYSATKFAADPRGTVDLNSARAVTSSGEANADPGRPFWSMVAVRELPQAPPSTTCDAESLRAGEVRLVVEANGQLVARAVAGLRLRDPV